MNLQGTPGHVLKHSNFSSALALSSLLWESEKLEFVVGTVKYPVNQYVMRSGGQQGLMEIINIFTSKECGSGLIDNDVDKKFHNLYNQGTNDLNKQNFLIDWKRRLDDYKSM